MNQIKKYWQLFLVTWQNGLVYPVSVLFWRIRQFLSTIMSLTIWTAIFTTQQTAFQYNQNQMITYIFIVGVLQSLILATVLNGLAETIYTGKLSYELMKPVNIYFFLGIQELADKLKNFIFIVVESGLLFLLFKPVIIFPSAEAFLIFLLSILLGALLLFIIMLLFGVIGFWSSETWGPRFLFYMFLDFTAGKLFPLDILPSQVQKIVFLTPFPYLSYVQSQIFLGKYSPEQIGQTFAVLGLWILILGFLFRVLWKKGIKEYGAMGH